MNNEITARRELDFFVHDFAVFWSRLGDFPLAQRMHDGHQMKRLDFSFPAQFES